MMGFAAKHHKKWNILTFSDSAHPLYQAAATSIIVLDLSIFFGRLAVKEVLTLTYFTQTHCSQLGVEIDCPCLQLYRPVGFFPLKQFVSSTFSSLTYIFWFVSLPRNARYQYSRQR